MKSDNTIRLLIASFASQSRQTLKGQVVAQALINYKRPARSMLALEDALGTMVELPTA